MPWLLAEEARHLFGDKRWTADGLRNKIKAEYDIVADIFDTARTAQCSLYYPFAGEDVGPFRILSPSRETYRYLLPQFDKTPDADQAASEAAGMWIGKQNVFSRMFEAAKAAIQSWTTETWDYERLRDGGITSASNESSVVLYGTFERGSVLLTGDAGIRGLHWAANAAEGYGLPLRNFRLVQVPHHGSRRNVGPTILTRLLGNKQHQHEPTRFSAVVSAPKDDAQHPRRIVSNAFLRRGALVSPTQGESVIYRDGYSLRPGEGPAPTLPFYTRVEEYT